MNRRDAVRNLLGVSVGAITLSTVVSSPPFAWSGLRAHQSKDDFAAYLKAEGHEVTVWNDTVFWREDASPCVLRWVDRKTGFQTWDIRKAGPA